MVLTVAVRPAFAEIIHLLETNSFRRFRLSPYFEELLSGTSVRAMTSRGLFLQVQSEAEGGPGAASAHGHGHAGSAGRPVARAHSESGPLLDPDQSVVQAGASFVAPIAAGGDADPVSSDDMIPGQRGGSGGGGGQGQGHQGQRQILAAYAPPGSLVATALRQAGYKAAHERASPVASGRAGKAGAGAGAGGGGALVALSRISESDRENPGFSEVQSLPPGSSWAPPHAGTLPGQAHGGGSLAERDSAIDMPSVA